MPLATFSLISYELRHADAYEITLYAIFTLIAYMMPLIYWFTPIRHAITPMPMRRAAIRRHAIDIYCRAVLMMPLLTLLTLRAITPDTLTLR